MFIIFVFKLSFPQHYQTQMQLEVRDERNDLIVQTILDKF